MKQLLHIFLVSALLITTSEIAYAQQNETVYSIGNVTRKPTFQGGDANKFSAWVNSQLRYPEMAKKNNIQGRVIVQFTINEDGSVSDAKVLRGVEESLDMEAVRTISLSPKWKSGYNEHGEPVKVQYTFPVIFQCR